MTEAEIIAQIFAPLTQKIPGAVNLEDDVALLPPLPAQHKWIVTSDALAEGTHFLPQDDLAGLGQKLVAVNVSDCLAKGGKPCLASLVLAWPESRPSEQIALFAQGLKAGLDAWNCVLIGGDTIVSQAPLCVSLTLHGQCRDRAPIRRDGAKNADHIWVSGTLGEAVLGLHCARGALSTSPKSHCVQFEAAYRTPCPPPLSIAALITDHAHAAIDISDGLVADATRLAQASGLCLQIDAEAIPISAQAQAWMGDDIDRLIHLITGGDDYQSLFTAPPEAEAAIQAACHADKRLKLSRIGTCAPAPAVAQILHKGQVLKSVRTGFDHFDPAD